MTPQNIEGRLHLALLFLAHQDYESAHSHLKTLASHLRPYQDRETAILMDIASFGGKNSDFDPKAIAVRSYAAYLIKRNRVDAFDTFDSMNLESEYFQKESKIPPHLRLSKEEEELLFPNQSVQANSKIILQDKFLTGNDWIDIVKTALFDENTNIYQGYHYVSDSLYTLLRAPLTETSARAVLDSLSSSIQTPLSLDQMKEEIEKQFLLTMKDPIDSGTKAATVIYFALLHDPESFPTIESIKQQANSNRKKWIKTNLSQPAFDHLMSWVASRKQNLFSTLTDEDVFWPKPIEAPPKTPLPFINAPPRFSDAASRKAPFATLNEYLEEIPLSSEKQARFHTANEMLQKIFSYKPADRVAKRKFEDLHSEIKKYGATTQNSSLYQIRSGADIAGLEKKLSQEAAHLIEKLIVQEERLIALASQPPSLEKESLFRQFQKQSGDRKEPSLSDIVLNFGGEGYRNLQQLNPALVDAEIHKLAQMTGAYLVQATHYQHLLRILASLKTIQNAVGKPEEEKRSPCSNLLSRLRPKESMRSMSIPNISSSNSQIISF